MHRMTAMLAFLALFGLLAGCQADKTQNWDYGKSFHAVFDNQKIPPAPGDDTPVVGMDGEKAAIVYDRYQKAKPSEKETAPNSMSGIAKGQ